ncbi:MAG: ATP-binding protein [Candidatus Bathyarchaeota archaeon]|nr:ATP-binding protein [Candidatus Bathyarchaeota archaeon]
MFNKPLFGLNYLEERQYRTWYAKEDIKLARYGLIIAVAAWIAFAFNDYQILGLSQVFFFSLAIRVALSAVAISVAVYLAKVNSYQVYDKVLFVLAFALIIAMLTFNATRPQSFLTHSVITAAVILLVGLYIPTKLVSQIILSATACAGEIIVVSSGLPWDYGLFTVVFSLVTAFFVTVICSYNLQLFRRRDFKNMANLSEMKVKVEKHSKELERVVEEKTLQLKNSERLSAIGMTAGMIGHDIRNPLQAIEGDIYLLRTGLDEMPQSSVKEELQESIQGIEDNISYINKIVADLQDFARPLNPSCVQVDFREQVFKTIGGIKFPKNIEIQTDVDIHEPVEVDPEFFRRVLTNLVLNGIQAMPNGGILTVRALEKDGNVEVYVGDTGLGIPEEIKPKLFTPMVTTKSKGQGLGLAVVKRLVEALGGTITYTSQKGKGTTFEVRIPLKQKQIIA